MKKWLIGALAISTVAYAAVNVTINGSTYSIPQKNEKGWGDSVTSWIQAASQHLLQKTGGTFTLSGEVNFGSSYGLKGPYYKSSSSNIADSGVLRLSNTDKVGFRNNANSGNLLLGVNTSDQLTFNGNPIIGSSALSANKALVSDAGGAVSASSVTSTELGYSSGVTSSLCGINQSCTLTNKTLTAPVISTISNTGTLTLPTSTDTLVGRATTDTLTNKSISGATNTLSAIPDTALNTISTAGKVSNSATTATNANTASAIVARDASGNFSAGTISANLTGNVTGNVTGAVTGNASTATALAANPSDCGAGTKATAIDASGNLTCSSVDLSSDTAATALPATKGGTGQTSFTTGDILYASSSSALSKLNVGSSGQFLKVAGGVPSWGPGASGINYFSSNPDAESDTTGWTTYADAAATPVDGTGGSPTATWTRSTSSPLRGSGSFLFTMGTLGDGVAFPFTLDSADKARVMTITADYTVVSGTYTDGMLAFYIYDVTNAQIIQPASYQVMSVTAGLPTKISATFQTSSSSTSYRFLVHQVSAGSAVVKFDNFSLSPVVAQYGAVVTDWQSYTPTWSASSAPSIGNGTLTGKWRRVGDSMEVQIQLSTGSTTTYGSGGWTFSLPSGYSMDTAKMSASTPTALGHANMVAASANFYVGEVNYASTTTVQVSVNANGNTVRSTVPATWTTSDALSMMFKVPVQGWSSGVITSDQSADSRVVSFLTRVDTASGTQNSSFNTISFGAAARDTTNSFNGTDTYTVPVSGIYDLSASVLITYASASAVNTSLGFSINGASPVGVNRLADSATAAHSISAQYLGVPLNAGDTVKVQGKFSGTTPGWGNGASSSGDNYFSVVKRQGPNQVAATETVAARYTNGAGTTITKSANNTVPFATKDFDSHGAFVTDTFTAPVSGKYEVKVQVLFQSATWASGDLIEIDILKNGSTHSTNTFYVGWSYTGQIGHQTSGLVPLVAGDTIKIQVFPQKASAGNLTLSTSAANNAFTINRVGN